MTVVSMSATMVFKLVVVVATGVLVATSVLVMTGMSVVTTMVVASTAAAPISLLEAANTSNKSKAAAVYGRDDKTDGDDIDMLTCRA